MFVVKIAFIIFVTFGVLIATYVMNYLLNGLSYRYSKYVPAFLLFYVSWVAMLITIAFFMYRIIIFAGGVFNGV